MEAQFTKEEALREKILQAAQQLFQRYGLRKVTMDDSVREAGPGLRGCLCTFSTSSASAASW